MQSVITPQTLQQNIEEVVISLLNMAGRLTYNKISGNCIFILSEIKNDTTNSHVQRTERKKENDKKTPVALNTIMPHLLSIYDNLYDINLHVYKAEKNYTIIDIRYYPKSSIDEEYRQNVIQNPPMLHCKIAMPPWLIVEEKKFDINWEHKIWLIRFKRFLSAHLPIN